MTQIIKPVQLVLAIKNSFVINEIIHMRFSLKTNPKQRAAAQTVVITNVIDSTKFDLSTFTLGPITFLRDKVVDVPSGERPFVTAVDLRPANNLIVRIDAGIDLATGIATWRFGID